MRSWLLFGAVAVLAACTRIISDPLPDRPVDQSFSNEFFNWEDGSQISFAYLLFESEHKVGICGAWSASSGGGHHRHRFDEMAVQAGSLVHGGRTLVNDIGFFRKGAFSRGERPQGNASCIRIDTPWVPSVASHSELAFSRASFKILD